jgi:hypothetical protein
VKPSPGQKYTVILQASQQCSPERGRLGRSNSQTLDRVRTSPSIHCIENRERWAFSTCCARDGHSPAERGRLGRSNSQALDRVRRSPSIDCIRIRQRWTFSTCCARDGHSPAAERRRLRPQQLSNTRSREKIATVRLRQKSRENIAIVDSIRNPERWTFSTCCARRRALSGGARPSRPQQRPNMRVALNCITFHAGTIAHMSRESVRYSTPNVS